MVLTSVNHSDGESLIRVARQPEKKPRAQESIRRRGNSFQVLVYSGLDPLTGRRLYLSESTTDEAEAKRILNKFRAQVDDQLNARTRALFRVAIEEWLKVHELEETTRDGYEMYARNYINPALGNEPVSKISARVLEQFYAELRRCRTRCDGRPAIDHREDGPHECRVVRHKRPPGRPPAGGYPDHDCEQTGCSIKECLPHKCRPLASATIAKIHFIMSGALSAAVRWDWISSNPADVARRRGSPLRSRNRRHLNRPGGSSPRPGNRIPIGEHWSGSSW